ncbi:MAG: integration host factor subunit alpha [Magnetococcus sp. DMHC-6]
MASLTKVDLVNAVSEQSGRPKAQSCEVVELILEILIQRLEAGETVKLSGFGVFSVRSKRARQGRNPRTGEAKEISARKVVTFSPSPLLI